MKGKILLLVFCVFLLLVLGQNSVSVKADLTGQAAPKVGMQEVHVNASVSKLGDQWWATVDAWYQMHTVLGYGESYVVENVGMGLIANPTQKYVTVTVSQDVLEAHLPIAANSTDILVTVNGQQTAWQQDRAPITIIDSVLPQINWTISPVPRDFNMTVRYKTQVLPNQGIYYYLGDYAFMLPVYGLFSCSNLTIPLYGWSGYATTTSYSVNIKSDITQTTIYYIDTKGRLSEPNATSITKDGLEVAFQPGELVSVQGAIAFFNSPKQEGTTYSILLVVGVAVFAIVASSVIVYYKKFRH